MNMDVENIILVTGGAGYIGSQMVYSLINAGYTPIVIDNLSSGELRRLPEKIKFYNVDLRNKHDLELVFKENSISSVIHFAGSIKVGESVENPIKYYRNNLNSTINLLELMVNYDVNTIVFSSTAAVFGEPNTVPINESHSKNPLNPYGSTKLMCERIIHDFSKAYSINAVLLRYFNACGADDKSRTGFSFNDPTHLIPRLLLSLVQSDVTFEIFGSDYDTRDGTCIRDYIHVMDLCEAHLLSLKYIKDKKGLSEFNLGNGRGYTINEIIKVVESCLNVSISRKISKRRPGDPAVLVADSSRIKTLLDWSPKHSTLEQIINDSWRWISKNITNRMINIKCEAKI